MSNLPAHAWPLAAVERIERRVIAAKGAARKPKFWHDDEVRRAVIALHGTVTVDQARAWLLQQFGAERAASRSAIHRFWQSYAAEYAAL